MDHRLLTKLGTLRQLEIFMKVAEKSSIARAAEELYLTQPSVSNQIKKLSDALDIVLYEVIGKKIYLTEAGKEVVSTGQELFQSIQRLDENLNNLKGLTAGVLRVAIVTTAKYFLPHILGPFCKQYPDIDVEFKVGNRAQIIDRLKNNLDDLYIFSDPPNDLGVIKYQFLPNPLAVIASIDHSLSKKRRLTWQDLSEQKFLIREQGSGSQAAIEQHLKKHRRTIKRKMVIESNEAIKQSVIANMGIAILSAYALGSAKEDRLVLLPVESFPIQSNWYVVHLKQKKLSLLAECFLDFLLTKGPSLLPLKAIDKLIKKANKS
ncbi:MAG: DNA-binding transcriptional LysR family regulator [Oceanicoccus sp.]|jgi:DNA-binding transcriptional LysR family regulator